MAGGSSPELETADAVLGGAVTSNHQFRGSVSACGAVAADIAMLEGVGVGYLMGNANPNLTVAAHVKRALSNDEDGIGVAPRKHFPSDKPFSP